jgi:hypothetical protein
MVQHIELSCVHSLIKPANVNAEDVQIIQEEEKRAT